MHDPKEARERLSIQPGQQSPEVLQTDFSRVLVYGTHSSGAALLAHELEEYINQQGIPDVGVTYVRDASRLYRAFFGGPVNSAEEEYALGPQVNSLPRAVILLPEMRQEAAGMWMTIDPYAQPPEGENFYEKLKKLCQEHGVIFIPIRESMTPIEIQQSLKLLPSPQ